MLARTAEIFRSQHIVDGTAKRIDRLFKAFQFKLAVLRDQLRHMDARLVQHRMAERDAFRKGGRGDVNGRLARATGLVMRRSDKVGGGNDFGQHHRDRLQRLDFFFGVVPLGAVLHDQNADNLAAA